MAPRRWEISRASEVGGYYLLACVEARTNTLFVFIGGPPLTGDDPAPDVNQVVVHTPPRPTEPPPPDGPGDDNPIVATYTSPQPTGEALAWRGQDGAADKHDGITMAKFDRPAMGVEYLDVTIENIPGFYARLVPVR